MPTDTVTVWQVNAWPRDGYTVWEIRTSGPVVTTTHAFRASLCQRAKDLHRSVTVTWRQDGWGVKQGRLMDVQLASEKGAA